MKAVLLCMLLLIGGCSGLSGLLLPSLGQGISADAELTVGDKEENITAETQFGGRQEQTAQTINNVNDIPLSWIILFTIIAGWAIPSPAECGRGVLVFLKALLPWSR